MKTNTLEKQLAKLRKQRMAAEEERKLKDAITLEKKKVREAKYGGYLTGARTLGKGFVQGVKGVQKFAGTHGKQFGENMNDVVTGKQTKKKYK